MSEKSIQNYLILIILTCLLNPHSFVSTKQTCQYIRDCFDFNNLIICCNTLMYMFMYMLYG